MMHGVPGASRRTCRNLASSAMRSPLGNKTMFDGRASMAANRSGARKKAPTAVDPAP
jgi:hypothetical protein